MTEPALPDALPAGAASVVGTQLERLAQIAAELGDQALASDARADHDRLVEARFFVACLGQFKRGKSTLLNGLVGPPILPVGVVPVTSVVTILRHGDRGHRQRNRSRCNRNVSDLRTVADRLFNPRHAIDHLFKPSLAEQFVLLLLEVFAEGG